MQMEHERIGGRWSVTRLFFENRFPVLQDVLPAANLAARVFQFPFKSAHHEIIVIRRDNNWQRKTSENAVRFTRVPKLRRLVVLWRTGCAQNIHDIFFWRVWIGLYGRILRNTHKISIREWISVALRELFRDVGTKRKRAITGARSQKRSALPRLNPAQESIPVGFLKFTRHIKQTNERP